MGSPGCTVQSWLCPSTWPGPGPTSACGFSEEGGTGFGHPQCRVQGRGMQVWVWGFGEMWVLYQLVWVTLCEAWGTAWGGLRYGTNQCGVQGWEV